MKFFDWAYRQGDEMASDLDYVPLPDKVAEQVRQTSTKGDQGQVGASRSSGEVDVAAHDRVGVRRRGIWTGERQFWRRAPP